MSSLPASSSWMVSSSMISFCLLKLRDECVPPMFLSNKSQQQHQKLHYPSNEVGGVTGRGGSRSTRRRWAVSRRYSCSPSPPAASSSTARSVLITAVIIAYSCVSPRQVSGVAPLAGGAGYADYFDHQRPDVLAMRWSDPPRDGLTVEGWLRLVDWHITPALFSYAVYDSATMPAYDQANELMLYFTPEQQTFFRATSRVSCHSVEDGEVVHPECAIVKPREGWTHVATTWDRSTGIIAFYKNGELLFESEAVADVAAGVDDSDGDRLSSPRGGGVFVLGQEMDGFLSGFDERQSLDAILDEFRIWDRPLSVAEIQENMHRVLDVNQHNATGLHLLWQFDRFGDGRADVEDDMSGNGHDAMVGALPSLKNEMRYLTSRGIVKPTSPLRVASRAPVFGGTVVVFASWGVATPFLLPAFDPQGRKMSAHISRPPSAGTLALLSGELQPTVIPESGDDGTFELTYRPSARCDGLDVIDSFEYSAVADDGESSAAATVVIHCLDVESPADAQRLLDPSTGEPAITEIEEDQPTVLILGGVGRDGEPVAVNITELPTRGQLYQLEFEDEERFYAYTDVVYPGSEPITEAGARVACERGAVLYLPEADTAYETSLKYVHVLASGHVSPEGELKIRVVAANDPPRLDHIPAASTGSSRYSVPQDGQLEIELAATDVDSSFSSSVEFTVTSWPALGRLYQEDASAPIEERNYVPQVTAWGAAIPPYNAEWGPSFSSQYSHCSCCTIQKTCPHGCGCSNPSWRAEQALGEPDAYPVYGDSTLGWEPSTENAESHEFLTLEYLDAVYVSKVSIYEVFNPGSVWRISSAASYRGNATEWSVLWEGQPDPWAPKESRIFSPPLCSDVSQKAKYIRIHVNASAAPGWHVIDAVSLQGSFQYPPGRVKSEKGKLVYKPHPGVHVTGQRRDRVLVTASDCLAASEASAVEIMLSAPDEFTVLEDDASMAESAPYSSMFTPAQVVEVEMFDTAVSFVSVDVARAREHALAALTVLAPGESLGTTTVDLLPARDAAFSTQLAGNDDAVIVQQQDGKLISTTKMTRLTDDQHRFRLQPPQTTGWTGSHNFKLRVWATTAEIVHRLDIQLQPVCPPDAAADTCALKAADCVDIPGSTFDATKWRCVVVSSNRNVVYLIIGVIIALLAILAAFLVWHNRKLRMQVHSQQEEETLEMDMQSPLAKIIEFLRSYQKLSSSPWCMLMRKGPSFSEAASLEKLVLKMSGRLGAIDLKGQLTAPQPRRNLNPDMIHHLIREYDSLDGSSGASIAAGSLSHRDLDLDFDNKCASVVALVGSSFICEPQEERRQGDRLGTRRQGWAQAGDSTTELMVLSPAVDMEDAGTDFFLDAVTDRSILRTLPQPLAAITESILHNIKLDAALPKASIPTLIQFVLGIEAGYAEEGYHCRLHATDVTNRLAAILFHSGIATAEDCAEHQRTVLAAIIAAVVHDYKHPQVNNAYLVEEESPISLEFNDYAVLEMYSLRAAFQLLTSSAQFNFTSDWSVSMRKAFRKTVINVVLATDMGTHFDLVGQFTTTIGQAPKLAGLRGAEKWRAMDSKEKLLTLKVAMKVADIGHCFTRLDQHQSWVARLAEEFFKQGDSERRKGRKPSPLMNRELPGVADANNSIGFFNVIALPLLNAWVDVFPECQELLNQAHRNLEYWKLNLRVDK